MLLRVVPFVQASTFSNRVTRNLRSGFGTAIIADPRGDVKSPDPRALCTPIVAHMILIYAYISRNAIYVTMTMTISIHIVVWSLDD